MVAVLLHLASPINARKRQSFCNTIIINILQPIEKEPSAGKFNKKISRRTSPSAVNNWISTKTHFSGSSIINRHGYPQPNRPHLTFIKKIVLIFYSWSISQQFQLILIKFVVFHKSSNLWYVLPLRSNLQQKSQMYCKNFQ